MTIQEFVEADEYVDTYRKDCDWKGFTVYEIYAKADEGACIGYPQFALEKDDNIRRTTFEETLAIMDATPHSDDE